MEKQIKRIGILTSGGDAPGMNAVVRSVVRTASAYGISCLGIRRGYSGLINGDIIELGARSVDGIIAKGGTMLYTARCLEMLTDDGLTQAANNAHYMGLDGLVVCGGDGSFRGAQALSRKGVPAIGIPGTIDNDIVCSDYTIGFDSACNTAIQAIDKLRDTMQSHERCSVVEVMGRRAGHLALDVGVAVSAAENITLLLLQRASAMHRMLQTAFTLRQALMRALPSSDISSAAALLRFATVLWRPAWATMPLRS